MIISGDICLVKEYADAGLLKDLVGTPLKTIHLLAGADEEALASSDWGEAVVIYAVPDLSKARKFAYNPNIYLQTSKETIHAPDVLKVEVDDLAPLNLRRYRRMALRNIHLNTNPALLDYAVQETGLEELDEVKTVLAHIDYFQLTPKLLGIVQEILRRERSYYIPPALCAYKILCVPEIENFPLLQKRCAQALARRSSQFPRLRQTLARELRSKPLHLPPLQALAPKDREKLKRLLEAS